MDEVRGDPICVLAADTIPRNQFIVPEGMVARPLGFDHPSCDVPLPLIPAADAHALHCRNVCAQNVFGGRCYLCRNDGSMGKYGRSLESRGIWVTRSCSRSASSRFATSTPRFSVRSSLTAIASPDL